jgi:predicted N-acetyltransferase YhbS
VPPKGLVASRKRNHPLRFVSEALTDQHDLSQFSCGKEELDDWLRSSALHAAAMNTGRTFVWRADQRGVVAYFTLAAHLIAREQIPRKVGRGSPQMIPAVLLAKLALDESLAGQGLGGELLWDSLSRATAASQQAAARLVVVDAIDDRAVSFYEHFGFTPLPGNPRRLVQKMSDIDAALASGRTT